MNVYEVYGFKDIDISSIRERLEAILNVEFIAHESEYIGEHYLSQLRNLEIAKLVKYDLCYNYHEVEGWREEDFPECDIILYATFRDKNLHKENELIKNILDFFPNCKPLRRSELISGVVDRIYLYNNGKFELTHEISLSK